MHQDELLTTLRRLEEELHRVETRRDADRMQSLLHPDFEEFGRSGRRYTRAEVVSESANAEELAPVMSRDFRLATLDDRMVLLTYVSAHVDAAGTAHRFTLRSSLWLRTPSGWRLRFHQGTPADEAVS